MPNNPLTVGQNTVCGSVSGFRIRIQKGQLNINPDGSGSATLLRSVVPHTDPVRNTGTAPVRNTGTAIRSAIPVLLSCPQYRYSYQVSNTGTAIPSAIPVLLSGPQYRYCYPVRNIGTAIRSAIPALLSIPHNRYCSPDFTTGTAVRSVIPILLSGSQYKHCYLVRNTVPVLLQSN